MPSLLSFPVTIGGAANVDFSVQYQDGGGSTFRNLVDAGGANVIDQDVTAANAFLIGQNESSATPIVYVPDRTRIQANWASTPTNAQLVAELVILGYFS